MIKFRCNECQHKIAVPNDYEGRYVKCPACSAPTLARNEPIAVQGLATGRVPASAATGTTAAVRRAAAPTASPRPAHIPEARPARSSHSPLASSQASELLKALDDPPSTTSLPEELTLKLDAELAADQVAADVAADAVADPGHHHVPHVHVPQYVFLQVLGFMLIALSAMAFMLWVVLILAVLVGSNAVREVPQAAGPALAVTFGSGLIGILWVCATGQALLALRDIARNSWYHKETAALIRQGARP